MNIDTTPTSQQRSDRRLMRALGSGLSRHLSDEILEPPPEDLLLLLVQADRKRAPPAPAKP